MFRFANQHSSTQDENTDSVKQYSAMLFMFNILISFSELSKQL